MQGGLGRVGKKQRYPASCVERPGARRTRRLRPFGETETLLDPAQPDQDRRTRLEFVAALPTQRLERGTDRLEGFHDVDIARPPGAWPATAAAFAFYRNHHSSIGNDAQIIWLLRYRMKKFPAWIAVSLVLNAASCPSRQRLAGRALTGSEYRNGQNICGFRL